MDGRFPTLKSPNPENAEALKIRYRPRAKGKSELVAATDPDCDRLGVAVRTASSEMKLLSGNQIGSVLAWYRAKTFFDRGILNKENAHRGVVIKTFVTSDLQKVIAEKFGLRCIDTLTGFKYNGAKLNKYEEETGYTELPGAVGGRNAQAALAEIVVLHFRQRRKLRLQRRRFRARQGWERCGDHVLRSRRLRQIEGNDFGRIARRNFSASSVTLRKRITRSISKARMGRRRSPTAHFLR
jgi:phosphomannomutase